MIAFGGASSEALNPKDAAADAVSKARSALGGRRPAIAFVFASPGYADIDALPAALAAELGDVPIVGGTAGGSVFGPEGVYKRGVSVVIAGGDGIAVVTESATISSPDLVALVPAAEKIARAADIAATRGLSEFACLAFAPGVLVDGEALVAALRKGAGARAQLAGALTGDDLTFDRARALGGGELRGDRIVVAGIFTKRPLGIAARHGFRAVGPARTVTRSDGFQLLTLDGRRALDVWLEDVRAAGGSPPTGDGLALYLATYYEIGMQPRDARARANGHELVIRAPFAVRADGAVQMSASIAEGTTVRVVHASREDLLGASKAAAAHALDAAGGSCSGALVLACAGRLSALGHDFPTEPRAIASCLSAPVGGSCVFGEIARSGRDVDAFFNTTAVVIAFPGK